MRYKIGLDLHGVITQNPLFFAEISKLFLRNSHELHIITGSDFQKETEAIIHSYGVRWTKVFSIIKYHKILNTPIRYDEKGNPWIEENIWNKAKAEYCKREKIDFHIDDSEKYGQHFNTPYCLYKPKLARFCWFYKDLFAGEFIYNDPKVIYENILGIMHQIGSPANHS